MIIRQQQMDRFRDEMLQSFEDEMVAHLAEFSPPLFRAIKEPQMRSAARFGIRRAAEHGFTNRGPIQFYLELMLLFGSHFDTDPQYPWAGEILDATGSQTDRAARLYQKTCEYRAKVNGPDDEYTLRALKRLSARAREDVPPHAESVDVEMRREFLHVYPEKASYIGEDSITQLLENGLQTAGDIGFAGDRATGLTLILMFAFGHGCFDDLLYPWIKDTVTSTVLETSAARAARLETKALTWLDHVVANFEEGRA